MARVRPAVELPPSVPSKFTSVVKVCAAIGDAEAHSQSVANSIEIPDFLMVNIFFSLFGLVVSPGHFGLSSTACSLPLALVASQRIRPDSLMSTASVRVKPVPEGIRVLRLTNPLAVEMKGTCLPALKGL